MSSTSLTIPDTTSSTMPDTTGQLLVSLDENGGIQVLDAEILDLIAGGRREVTASALGVSNIGCPISNGTMCKGAQAAVEQANAASGSGSQSNSATVVITVG